MRWVQLEGAVGTVGGCGGYDRRVRWVRLEGAVGTIGGCGGYGWRVRWVRLEGAEATARVRLGLVGTVGVRLEGAAGTVGVWFEGAVSIGLGGAVGVARVQVQVELGKGACTRLRQQCLNTSTISTNQC